MNMLEPLFDRLLVARARFGLAGLMLVFLSIQPAYAQQTQEPGQDVTDTVVGIVSAANSWDVTPKVSNLISQLHFIEGQKVEKGDLLVEFETGFMQLEVELAEVARLQAEVRLADKEDDLQRQEKLKAREAVSVKSYRNAYFAVELAKADLKFAEVQLKKATAILGAQKIYAPFDGLISVPLYRENAYVDLTEGTEIATIVQLDPIYVLAPISVKRLLTRLKAGEFGADFAKQFRVELKLSDGLVYKHFGQIVSTGVGIDTATGQGTIVVSFPNPQGILRPGLKVSLTGYRN